MQNSILIVDDDRDIRDDLKDYLKAQGFDVSVADGSSAARRMIQSQKPDLVLLDIMMPGEDGLSLCRSLTRLSQVPIIFLSAKTEQIDRIVGLEVGADDYVCKPFYPRELLARIRSVLRRSKSEDQTPNGEAFRFFEFDRWTLDVARQSLRKDDDVVVSLSSGEFRLLLIFLERPNIVLPRDRIVELSHEAEADVFDRSVDTQISRLRRKIERDPKHPELIKTVWGGGYVFSCDVKRL